MLDASQIQQEAVQFIINNPKIKDQIENLQNDYSKLFDYFINCVKRNEFLIVSYILNYCFDDASKRANFGNQQDELGNIAYHYAAEYGFDEIVVILNDKRKFHDKQVFFRFKLQNKLGKTPLEICCESGHLSTFNLIWERAGKSNHNPMYALPSACIGSNEAIIERIINHPKFSQNNPFVCKVYKEVLCEKYNDTVKKVLNKKFKFEKISHVVIDGLQQYSLFKEEPTFVEHKNKRLCVESKMSQFTLPADTSPKS